ncbi:MAG: hypothetical protein A2Y07_03100 [Planctomycetes bacterium GWF2_50_10]|nr:MAG: hypothetical protein A2Y07_03100 [Planctomycetes bacterium GWF2_50_10]
MSVATNVAVTEAMDLLCSEYDESNPKLPTAAVVVAHHDDEVAGMGAQFLKFGEVYFIHVTDGAARDMADATRHGFDSRGAYASVRQKEFASALQIAHIDQNRIIDVGIADKEASLNMAHICRELVEILMYIGPQMIFTHPYEGGHPDHDATVLGLRAAVRQIAKNELNEIAVFEFTSYFDDNGSMGTGKFLPGSDGGRLAAFTPKQLELKVRMMECFETQKDVLKYFPIQIERFRTGPAYNFTQSAGPRAYYDQFDWGVKSAQWQDLARSALEELGIVGPL